MLADAVFIKLFDNFLPSVLILDMNFNVQYFNKSFATLVGYTAKRIKTGESFFNYFNTSDKNQIFFKEVSGQTFSGNFEIDALKKDGKPLRVLANTLKFNYESTPILLINMVDISVETKLHEDYKTLDREIQQKNELKKAYQQLKDMQLQLLQSSKLASIGELAAGVAHEVNNPLTIIKGNVVRLKKMILSNQELAKDKLLNIIFKQEKSIERIANIVQGLGIYSRKSTDQIELINIHEILNDSLSMVRTMYEKEGIHFSINMRAENCYVRGNTSTLQQVVMNFISNARDAIENKDAGEISLNTENHENMLMISFQDNGHGIRPEHLDKIYDSFFTTKQTGKGTGLGLAFAYESIRKMSGEISVNTKLNEGTTFIIRIPFATEETLNEITSANNNHKNNSDGLQDDDSTGEIIL